MAMTIPEEVLRRDYDDYCKAVAAGYRPIGKGAPSAARFVAESNGRVSSMEVWVEDRGAGKDADWVSLPAAKG